MIVSFLSQRDSVRRPAIIAMLLAMVFSNTTPVFSKELYDAGWTPLSTYVLTLAIMTLLLAVHEFMALERGERWGMDRRDFVGTLLTTLTGGVLSPLLFFSGLAYVQASQAVLMTSMLPLFIVAFAVVFLKERFTPSTLAGGSLLLLGLIVLLWEDVRTATFGVGAVLLVLSSVFGALTTILHKKYVVHRHLDSIVLVRSVLSLLVCGAWMAFAEPVSFHLLVEPQEIWLVLGLPIVGFLLPFFLYFRALSHVTATEAGLVAAVGPVAGVLFAAVFRGDQISSMQMLSLACIVFGIFFINVPLTKLRIVPSRPPELGPLRK